MDTSIKFRGNAEIELNKYFIDVLRECLGMAPMSEYLHATKHLPKPSRKFLKRKVMRRGEMR